MTRTSTIGLVVAATILATGSIPAAQSDEAERLQEATTVMQEIMEAPDQAIPSSVIEKAAGIAVFPSTIKAGLVFGAHRGRGVISARTAGGGWSAPAFLTLTGGSFGAQIGGQAIDLVLVIMNERGLENLVSNQFTLGADASVAAGPVGRDAQAATDVQMRAQILSYSRTRGVFAGVTLKGTSIRQDRDANEEFHGYPYRTRQILFDGRGVTTAPVRAFTEMLARYAG